MEFIIWVTIVGGMLFMVWYGFSLLVRKPGIATGEEGEEPVAACHLCKRSFPLSKMVNRDKSAGFVNYFCGDCIEKLYDEYTTKFRGGGSSREGIPGRMSRN
jgi:hypothetical protein